ncbi:TonB-dependent receptor, partial [Xylella fastidiosa subsp. multiplex]|nr:TonB-dependent receptor [Xylella fastidiosa subsp. multiplex]
SGDDRLELSVQYRDETQIDNIGGQNAADHGLNKTNKDTRGSLRWQHSADAWFNELIFTREKARNNPNPMSIGNGFNYVYLDET